MEQGESCVGTEKTCVQVQEQPGNLRVRARRASAAGLQLALSQQLVTHHALPSQKILSTITDFHD